MTDLKTLKDLDTNLGQYGELDAVYIDELKAEAIKWIRLMDRNKTHYYSHPDARKWIKHFFNLREGDLREELSK